MTSTSFTVIDVMDVCLGLYIQLDVGWMHHPFVVSRFKVTTDEQLQTLRSCGVRQVRVHLDKSDAIALDCLTQRVQQMPSGTSESAKEGVLEAADVSLPPSPVQAPLPPVDRFVQAADAYQSISDQAVQDPASAYSVAHAMVSAYVEELQQSDNTMLRLLSGRAGAHESAHSVNVTILSLLLGKVCGLSFAQLYNLGMAALLHDVGKVAVPQALWERQPHMLPDEVTGYESHVGASVAVAEAMGLSPDIVQPIAQHHEWQDGSGFPLGLQGDELSQSGQMLGLVNAYDRLCNPTRQTMGCTPHEALSVLFAQRRHHFSLDLIKAFVRVMGVYPPGTVVQLNDGRFAIVQGVNASRPLKPEVRVYDVRSPSADAPVLDLEKMGALGIKRSLRPDQLPREALEYLSPQPRVCYFFERAVDVSQRRKVA